MKPLLRIAMYEWFSVTVIAAILGGMLLLARVISGSWSFMYLHR